jgi:DNA-binding response OmpR family regulator
MANSGKKTILIAEDDKGIIEVMKIILEQEGYMIETAHTAQDVKRVIDHTVPDLIFLDIRLGGESGEEIGEALRRNKRTMKVPLIMLSADQETKNITEKINASGFLLKPFDIESLLTIVRKYTI